MRGRRRVGRPPAQARWLDRLGARCLDRWGVILAARPPMTPYGHDFAANDLHLDEELVCPRCLAWIGPDDIVRRTAYGPAQHEACPLARTR